MENINNSDSTEDCIELPKSPALDTFMTAIGDHLLKMAKSLLNTAEKFMSLHEETQREVNTIRGETYEPLRDFDIDDLENSITNIDDPMPELNCFRNDDHVERIKKELLDPKWELPFDPIAVAIYLTYGSQFYLNTYKSGAFKINVVIPEILIMDRRMNEVVQMAGMMSGFHNSVVTNFKRDINRNAGQRKKYKEDKMPVYRAIQEFEEGTDFKNKKTGKITQSSVATKIAEKIRDLHCIPESHKTYTRFLSENKLTPSKIKTFGNDSKRVLTALKQLEDKL